MNTTPPVPPPAPPSGDPQDEDTGPRVDRDEVRDLARLRRSVDNRRVAGVAGGIARHLDIDPVIVRVVLVVLVFFGGAGLLLYAAGWLLVPEDGSSARPLGLDDRNRSVVLGIAGVLAALAVLGDWSGTYWFPWPVVVIALVVVWLFARARGTEGSASSTGGGRAAGNPRRRGPVLFWFTLALVATGIGTLGVIDVSGASVPDPAYPALALGLVGAMLVVGAFWGRAGGLVLLGLVAGVATLGATAGQDVEGRDVIHAPGSAAEVQQSYELHVGTMLVDLSGVEDVDALDGERIEVSAGAGEVEVVVPAGMDVRIDSQVGVGGNHVLDREAGGFGSSEGGFVDGGAEVPDMTIEIHLGVGQVTVREQ